MRPLTDLAADGLDVAGGVAAGGVGELRELGVLALADVRLHGVHPGVHDPHEHLMGALQLRDGDVALNLRKVSEG